MYNFKPLPNTNAGVMDIKTMLAVLASDEVARTKLAELIAKQEELVVVQADVVAARNQLVQEYKVLDQDKAVVASKLAEAALVLEDAEARRKASIAFQRAVEDREAALAATAANKEQEFAGRQAAFKNEQAKLAAGFNELDKEKMEHLSFWTEETKKLEAREAAVAEREQKADALSKLLKSV